MSVSVDVSYLLIGGVSLLVLGLLSGGFLVKRFGTDWLAMLAFLVSPEAVEGIARLAWRTRWTDASGKARYLVPVPLRAVLWGNSEDKFVAWCVAAVSGLLPKVTAIQDTDRALMSRGVRLVH